MSLFEIWKKYMNEDVDEGTYGESARESCMACTLDLSGGPKRCLKAVRQTVLACRRLRKPVKQAVDH